MNFPVGIFSPTNGILEVNDHCGGLEVVVFPFDKTGGNATVFFHLEGLVKIGETGSKKGSKLTFLRFEIEL